MTRNGTQVPGDRPVVGITMGDPAGIGPEIVLKAVSGGSLSSFCEPLLIGDLAFLRSQAELFGIDVDLRQFDPEERAEGTVPVRDLRSVSEEIVPGQGSKVTGHAAAASIIESVDLWRKGIIDAVATAPINKQFLKEAGFDFPGHTEFLADLTETRDFRMSFFAGDLRVVLLSTHLSLRDAIEVVTTANVSELIRFTDRELGQLLGKKVKIAVAGLNPHASEQGQFGSEEAERIGPAIEECKMVHEIDVSGPFSPDTVFIRGYRGEFDAVVACYHDQATIAVKCLSFGAGVNVTLGLPLVRTSVDHGTAFEIAGKGVADHSSMLAAVSLAADLAHLKSNSSAAV